MTTNLFQTSSKSAVETTELTRSFGWDSSEAWQQHDIQELCRVMFDALEQKFKDTDQADLIQRLYEGKILIVFVVCSPICISPNVYSSLFPRTAC
jgi:ubiquitin carboxyl-terminal hydrolase 47